jgi:hypothetical protein
MKIFARLPVLLLPLALMTAACSQSSAATTLAPTPAATVTTDTFTGTLIPLGTNSHSFTVAATGAVNITLLSVGPPATITVGLGVGTPSATSCALIQAVSTPAGTIAQLSGTANAGAFCISVFDVGNLSASVDYTVTVSHP